MAGFRPTGSGPTGASQYNLIFSGDNSWPLASTAVATLPQTIYFTTALLPGTPFMPVLDTAFAPRYQSRFHTSPFIQEEESVRVPIGTLQAYMAVTKFIGYAMIDLPLESVSVTKFLAYAIIDQNPFGVHDLVFQQASRRRQPSYATDIPLNLSLVATAAPFFNYTDQGQQYKPRHRQSVREWGTSNITTLTSQYGHILMISM